MAGEVSTGALTGGLRTAGPEGAGAGSPPARRRLASVSERRLASASCARRASSSRLRASAAARSSRSRASRSSRILASTSARLRSSTSRSRASERARERASRSSSVSERRITPDDARCGALRVGRGGLRARPWAAGGGGGGATTVSRGGCVSPGAIARRFTFSTTTAFERPCEKLWRTIPASTGRFKVSFLAGATLSVVSPGFLVSFISLTFPGPRPFGFIVPDVRHAFNCIQFIRFRSIPVRTARPGFPPQAIRTGKAPTSGSVPKTPRLPVLRSEPHVSHLSVPMPNPIGRTKTDSRAASPRHSHSAGAGLPEFAPPVGAAIRRMNEPGDVRARRSPVQLWQSP